MSLRRYRFFGPFMGLQEKWLNKMASKGYRLIRTEKMLYEFAETTPGKMRYCVEFIAHKGGRSTRDYKDFLEEIGYEVFFKNINLNYSLGKVRLRPWAENGGYVATNIGKHGTYDRELLIVGKENDGRDFELHTTLEDRIEYNRILIKPWIFLCLFGGIFGICYNSIIFCSGAVLCFAVAVFYLLKIKRLKREHLTDE